MFFDLLNECLFGWKTIYVDIKTYFYGLQLFDVKFKFKCPKESLDSEDLQNNVVGVIHTYL